MRPQQTLSLVQGSKEVALSRRESSAALAVPATAEPLVRLRDAGRGSDSIEPGDVLSVLAKIAAKEVAAAERLGDQLALFTDMLFQSTPSPTETMDYVERIYALHHRQQAELKKTLELLHKLASPPVAPTVNVLAVGGAGGRGLSSLGGKKSPRALSAKRVGGSLAGRKPARLLAGKAAVDLGGRHAAR